LRTSEPGCGLLRGMWQSTQGTHLSAYSTHTQLKLLNCKASTLHQHCIVIAPRSDTFLQSSTFKQVLSASCYSSMSSLMLFTCCFCICLTDGACCYQVYAHQNVGLNRVDPTAESTALADVTCIIQLLTHLVTKVSTLAWSLCCAMLQQHNARAC
jgi:hypothetical protein